MKKNPLIAAFLLLASLSSARADFLVITTPDYVAPAAASVPQATAPSKPAPSYTLVDALKLLAPSGWKGYSTKGLDTRMQVEVVRDDKWLDALGRMGQRYNLVIEVDQGKHQIFVSPGAGGMRDLQPTRPKTPTTPANAAPSTKQIPGGDLSFEVATGQRLSEALSAFLAGGNWKMEWAAGSDFIVRQGYIIKAKNVTEALDRILTGYGIHAELYTANRVAVIVSNAAPQH